MSPTSFWNSAVLSVPAGQYRGCALSHLMQSETVSCSCNRWWLKCTSSFQSLIASIQSVDCFISILLVHQWSLIDAIWIEIQSLIALIQWCWLHHFNPSSSLFNRWISLLHQWSSSFHHWNPITAILFHEKLLISESYYLWELKGVTSETHSR